MKKIIHKLIPFTLALALVFVFGVNASAETSQQADTAAEMNSAEESAAPYTMAVNDNGQTVLTFYAADGVISYLKAE